MNKKQKQRLTAVIIFMCGLSLAAGLIFYALKQNLNVFVTPSQLAEKHIGADYRMRLGGMVKTGSIEREAGSLKVAFIATDFKHDINVQYEGVLPDLFHEGKGMIAEGKMSADGVFTATRILAKHDENYMPAKVYKEIRNKNA